MFLVRVVGVVEKLHSVYNRKDSGRDQQGERELVHGRHLRCVHSSEQRPGNGNYFLRCV